MSLPFCNFVSAQATRWKAAGRVNAIGVQATAPRIDKNFPIFCSSNRVKIIEISTRIVLVTFLVSYLFLVFFHVA